MKQHSAGLLIYRRKEAAPELFLVHPGGPFWAKKDEGVWSIPKGLYDEGEDPLAAAQREFTEETGHSIDGEFLKLGNFKQPNGKVISAWAVEGDFDATAVKSNSFTMEWPPKSGKMAEFPEVDRAGWWRPQDALKKVVKGQQPIIGRLLKRLEVASTSTNKKKAL